MIHSHPGAARGRGINRACMTGVPLCQQDPGVEVGAGPLPEALLGAQGGRPSQAPLPQRLHGQRRGSNRTVTAHTHTEPSCSTYELRGGRGAHTETDTRGQKPRPPPGSLHTTLPSHRQCKQGNVSQGNCSLQTNPVVGSPPQRKPLLNSEPGRREEQGNGDTSSLDPGPQKHNSDCTNSSRYF